MDVPVGGRLSHFVKHWAEMPDLDPWVLSVVRDGYRIPFSRTPPLTSSPKFPPMPSEDRSRLVEKMVVELLDKGFSSKWISILQDFFPFILRKKKNGDRRPILNLKPLNAFVVVPSMKMETVQSVRALLKRGEWAVSIDLKDAYLHVPIHRTCWKFLRFISNGKAYEFRVLPFGLGTSPHAFTRVVKAVVGRVHLCGIRMHNYLDDWLIPASSKQACLTNLGLVLDMILRLGFLPNWVKSDLEPSQVFAHLGWYSILWRRRSNRQKRASTIAERYCNV